MYFTGIYVRTQGGKRINGCQINIFHAFVRDKGNSEGFNTNELV